MAAWKLTLSYDGTDFSGWQVQPGLATVQGTLATALEAISGERILPQGSGRTDAGVHALAQIVSFTLESPIPSANLKRALNGSLPASIRVLAVEEVAPSFHARHSAVGKRYQYRIFERKAGPGEAEEAHRTCSPFLARYVWDCRWSLDVVSMQRAAGLLCGTHDFTSFAAVDPEISVGSPNPIKTIHSAAWSREEGLLVYRIHGSGFLHHMVRNIVGTLVEIGRGALAVEDLPQILAACDRSAAGPTAPACGLFLHSVDYETSHDLTPEQP